MEPVTTRIRRMLWTSYAMARVAARPARASESVSRRPVVARPGTSGYSLQPVFARKS